MSVTPQVKKMKHTANLQPEKIDEQVKQGNFKINKFYFKFFFLFLFILQYQKSQF